MCPVVYCRCRSSYSSATRLVASRREYHTQRPPDTASVTNVSVKAVQSCPTLFNFYWCHDQLTSASDLKAQVRTKHPANRRLERSVFLCGDQSRRDVFWCHGNSIKSACSGFQLHSRSASYTGSQVSAGHQPGQLQLAGTTALAKHMCFNSAAPLSAFLTMISGRVQKCPDKPSGQACAHLEVECSSCPIVIFAFYVSDLEKIVQSCS